MSLDIGEALRDGAERTVEPTGLMLMAGFGVLGLVTAVLNQTYLAWYVEWAAEMGATPAGFEQPPLPLAVDIPVGAVLGAALVVAVVAEAFRIVAVRTMVGDHTDTIPPELFTRNIALATMNGFVGGVFVLILVGVGSLLVLPGIFLAIVFVFVRQEIAVRDVNFVDAMVGSWRLTEGSRVEIAVLGIVWITLWLGVFVATTIVGAVLPPGSPVGPLLGLGLRLPVTVFVVATASRAYVQLTGEQPVADASGEADGEEWPDPPGVDV